jgi:hypothetical protein
VANVSDVVGKALAATGLAVLACAVPGCGCGGMSLRNAKLVTPPLVTSPPLVTTSSETPSIAARPGGDLQNLYIFPSPNPANVVLVLTLHPLIPPITPGQDLTEVAIFDPNILFAIKIDNNGDFVEDLIIQMKASATGDDQRIRVTPPFKPPQTGTQLTFDPLNFASPEFKINKTFTYKKPGITGFAGLWEDPAFMDVNAFFSILPDRANPFGPTFTDVTGRTVSTTPANPNQFNLTSFRPPATAQDFFKGSNVLAIVLDLPRVSLAPPTGAPGVIHLWAVTAEPPDCGSGPQVFTQLDREGRPFTTTLLSTVANNRHQVNDTDTPSDDPNQFANDVTTFMGNIGRSQAVSHALRTIVVPDVLTADLSKTGPAGYLGVEAGGRIGAPFGGRKLTDDVVDTLLALVFGNTIPALNLAPDDGAETPSLTSDNVGPGAKHFLQGFPYLGPPQ